MNKIYALRKIPRTTPENEYRQLNGLDHLLLGEFKKSGKKNKIVEPHFLRS
jgi:hypothetical protein